MRLISPRKLFFRGIMVQIIIIVLLGFGLYFSCEYVQDRGLKNIWEDVWEGKK